MIGVRKGENVYTVSSEQCSKEAYETFKVDKLFRQDSSIVYKESQVVLTSFVYKKRSRTTTSKAAFHRRRCQRCCSQSFGHLHPLLLECVRSQATHRDVQQQGEQDAAL